MPNSPSHPTTRESEPRIHESRGWTHVASISEYTPPNRRTTKYRKKSLRSTFFGNDSYANAYSGNSTRTISKQEASSQNRTSHPGFMSAQVAIMGRAASGTSRVLYVW